MAQSLRRLSEQDLAQLYLHTQSALRLDDLLQAREVGDAALVAVHDSISDQTPDLALISLSLCGLVIARDYPEMSMGPVLRELGVAAENNLITVGRLWLDHACNGIEPNTKADRELIVTVPDRLRILASIFFELLEALDESDSLMARAIKTLNYQAESHADLSERFMANLARSVKKKPVKSKSLPNQIPLPFDLDRPRAGAEIVTFSLFREKR